jgi:hypothetical protein
VARVSRLSRRTGVQVGAIFDVRALLTPPLAAERMVRLSHENGVFVQKCLLERKRSYLTEKGLFSCKAPHRAEAKRAEPAEQSSGMEAEAYLYRGRFANASGAK